MTHLLINNFAFKQGYISYLKGKTCPYNFTSPSYFAWTSGWNHAVWIQEQLKTTR